MCLYDCRAVRKDAELWVSCVGACPYASQKLPKGFPLSERSMCVNGNGMLTDPSLLAKSADQDCTLLPSCVLAGVRRP